MVTDVSYVETKIQRAEAELRSLASTAASHQARIVAIASELAELDARASLRRTTLDTAHSTVQRLTDALRLAETNVRLAEVGDTAPATSHKQIEKQLRLAEKDTARLAENAARDEAKDSTRRAGLVAQRDQHEQGVMDAAQQARDTQTVLDEARAALGSAVLHNVTEGIESLDKLIALKQREIEAMRNVRNEQIADARGQLTDWPMLVKVLGEKAPAEDNVTRILEAARALLLEVFKDKAQAQIDSQVLCKIWQVNSVWDFIAMNRDQLTQPATVAERFQLLEKLLAAYRASKI